MNATASTTDFRKWTIGYTSYGTFVQVTLVEVQSWETTESTTFSTTEAWTAAKESGPHQIIVCGVKSTTVYHNNGTVEEFPAQDWEDYGNLEEARLAERESKADEEASQEAESRVGKVFIDSEGTFYRVKKTKSGYLVAQEWYGDTWGRTWGYSTSTWRTPTAEEAKAFGDSTHHCVFCHKGLTTKESKAVGYGPVCADNYGLPWGE